MFRRRGEVVRGELFPRQVLVKVLSGTVGDAGPTRLVRQELGADVDEIGNVVAAVNDVLLGDQRNMEAGLALRADDAHPHGEVVDQSKAKIASAWQIYADGRASALMQVRRVRL